MEELLLCRILAGDELYIVHKNDVHMAVHISELGGIPGSYGVYKLVGKLFTC